jgi:hypothetical protein
MDYLRELTICASEEEDMSRAYEFSQELYQVIYPKKEKIFLYDACATSKTIDQNE